MPACNIKLKIHNDMIAHSVLHLLLLYFDAFALMALCAFVLRAFLMLCKNGRCGSTDCSLSWHSQIL
jgi:hypothetical protein